MSLQEKIALLKETQSNWKNRVDKPQLKSETSTSLIKSNLTTAQSSWKRRVETKDAQDFTIKGKLERDQVFFQGGVMESLAEKEGRGHGEGSAEKQPKPIKQMSLFKKEAIPRQIPIKEPAKKPTTPEEAVKTALAAKVSYNILLKPLNLQESQNNAKLLYKIKGRTKPIPILVPTLLSNVNRADCFLLKTPNQIYHYYGCYSNLLEKTKLDEMYNNASHPKIKIHYNDHNWPEFISHFPANDQINPGDHGDESDAKWEEDLKKSVFVWRKEIGEWEEEEDYKEMEEELYLFDFGSEAYLYVNCFNVDLSLALETAKDLADAEVILVKRGLEPVEFTFKFSNLKKKSRIGRRRPKKEEFHRSFMHKELRDVIIIDGLSFTMEGVLLEKNKTYTTNTLEKYCFSNNSITPDTTNNFNSNTSYIIHWTYTLTTVTGKLNKTLAPTTSHGRPRSAWFFWHGNQTSALSRAKISTLFSVSTDFNLTFPGKSSKDPQITFEQGQEACLFLKLFQGSFHGDSPWELVGDEQLYYFKSCDTFHADGCYLSEEDECFHGEFVEPCKIDILRNLGYECLEKCLEGLRAKSVMRICTNKFVMEKLLDFKYRPVLEKNQNYLLQGNENFLILTEENYAKRRAVVLELSSECYGDLFVEFCWDFKRNLNFKQVLDFIKGVDDGDFFVEDLEDYEFYKNWYPLESVVGVLGERFVEDCLGLDFEEFRELMPWRQLSLLKIE